MHHLIHALILNTLVLFFIGIFAFIKRKDALGGLFFLMNMGFSIWNFSFYLFSISLRHGWINLGIVLRLELFSALIFAVCGYFFVSTFNEPDYLRRSKEVRTLSLLCLIATWISFSDEMFIFKNKSIVDVSVTGLPYITVSVFLLALFIAFIFKAVHAYRLNKEKRIAVSYFFFGIFLFACIGSISNLLLPIFGISDFLILGYIGITALSAMFFIAITKHELMDIKLIIGKTVAWVLTLVIAGVSFGVTAFALRGHLIESNVALSALGLAWALGGGWFQQKIITGNYYKFVKGYESAALISQISKTLSAQTSASGMFENLVALLHHELQIEHIAYYVGVRNQESEIVRYKRVYSLPDSPSQSESEIAIDDSFITTLKPMREPVRLSLILDTIPSDTQTLFKNEQLASDSLCLPLHSSPNLLEGVVVVGQRAGKRSYTKYDLDFFSALIDTASSLLLPLSPYEKLRKEFTLTQKQHYDSQIDAARSDKAGFLDYFLRGYAHEMITPLSLIGVNINFLPDTSDVNHLKNSHRHLPDDEEALLKKKVEKILTVRERCAEGVREALAILHSTIQLFRDESSLKKASVDLNQIIQEVCQKHKVDKILFDLHLGKIPIIDAIQHQVPLIFSNIIKNAIEAMPNGGTITIRSRIDEDDTNKVRIDILDTGTGMPPDVLNRIWDPFFTTHVHTGRGNGLGIVHRFIQDNHGHIEVKSTVGKGSTFSLFFPISASEITQS